MMEDYCMATFTQLYVQDVYVYGRPHFLSETAHNIWEDIAEWIRMCWQGLMSSKEVVKIFYDVLLDYYPREKKENVRYCASAAKLYYAEDTRELYIDADVAEEYAVRAKLDKIVYEARQSRLPVDFLESCFVYEACNYYFY